MKTLSLFLLLVFVLVAGERSQAQSENQAAFVTMLGDDTLAVERFHWSPTGMEAVVVLRSPRTAIYRYALEIDEAGGLRQFTAATHDPMNPDAPPTRRDVYTLDGDSLRITSEAEGRTQARAIAGTPQVLPFLDMIHWPFDLMLTRAHASGQKEVTQRLFTGRGSMPFVIRRTGEGTMTVTHPSRGTMEVEVDEHGRLLKLDAGATTRKLIVTRVPEIDVDALARRFAAQDAAGNAFGPLSGRGEFAGEVDGATITVDYGQPVRRGRELFGTLVPWGERWRTGANQATHFETDRTLRFGDLEVPPGRYTLYTIPQPDGGTLIINRQTGQGGTTYNEDQDLGRIPMTIATLPESVERFTILADDTADGGVLRLQWGETEFRIPFTVKR